MRNKGAAGILAAGAAVAGIHFAATANAIPSGNGAFSGPAGDEDASALWTDVNAFLPGWSADKDRQIAQMICGQLESGVSEGHLIAQIANGDASSVSDIRFVVHASEWHYCPTYY